MRKTIRGKIFIIVGLTLSALIIVLSIFSLIYFQNSKKIIINSFYHSISSKISNINEDIIKLEDNACDMALFGEFFFKLKLNQADLDHLVLNIIDEYGESLSGGIWYAPYALDKKRKHYSSFAYVNKQKKAVIDRGYENEKNSYFKQNWYKEIIEQIRPEKRIIWSSPYFEDIGVKAFMLTVGAGIYHDGKLVGISTVDWEIGSIIKDVSLVKPTENSFVLFADVKNDFVLVSTDNYLNNEEIFGKSVSKIPWYTKNLKNSVPFLYHGKKYIPYISYINNGMLLIVNIPENELYASIIGRFTGLFIILIFFSFFLCFFLYSELRNSIILPIDNLTKLANKISEGELNTDIVIKNPVEFAQLSQTFDKMIKDIKKITEKQTIIESELSIARAIQVASLPNIFPPYPNINEFDIFASMVPAKEVGGDFYDFYFLDSNHFMFLIADVSGKGVPAALFMMTIKTLISNMYQIKYSPKKLIENINKKICESNKEGLFVTLLACIIDINTGEMSCINCGHNPPLLKHSDTQYEYLKLPANMVLGAFKDAEYSIYNTFLNPGDRIFLYTDGITDSINEREEAFGEERLRISLNKVNNCSLKDTLSSINSDINAYSEGMNQFDDITMLIFQYNGVSNTKIFKDAAIKENYKKFYPILYSAASAWKLSEELSNKIYMCAEEIYANIVFYAYPEKTGEIEAVLSRSNEEITLVFTDEGIEYNPLEKSDPDINLPPEKRNIGGLGIFMVKQMADSISYERKSGKNILILKFKI